MPLKLVRQPLTLARTMLMLAILLLPILGFIAFLTSQQTGLILPARVNPIDAEELPPGYELLAITTPGGDTLHGILYLPKLNTQHPTLDTLILAFPGNTHNAVGFAAFLKSNVFPEDTVAVASLSYRGYPNGITPPSTGTPSQQAMYADSELIYDHLTARLKPTSVKVVGYSIGTAVATHLAHNRPVAAMALMAPIASVRRIAQDKYPWLPVRLLLRHPFATEDTIATLKTPTTLIYTRTDRLVPAAHVENILHTANPSIPLIAIPDTNHVTLILSDRIPALLRTALGYQ